MYCGGGYVKRLVLATLAHVDAGKTTLSESLLYLSSSIRQLGRVDHRNSFLDYDSEERNRGITIYNKESRIVNGEDTLIFIDTPGHVDFGSEMQRCLPVIDYAILLVSGIDGLQAHSETIYRLCEDEHIPLFIFVNKMDIAYQSEEALMKELRTKLSSHCVNFSNQETMMEEIAGCDEVAMEQFFENGEVKLETIQEMIVERTLFPVYFGSALKQIGIKELLDGLYRYTLARDYPDALQAYVYKISHDEKGQRLTHLKITGGKLQAKMKINQNEKVDQIRQYHGLKYQVVQEVEAGDTCCVCGLNQLQVRDTIRNEGYYKPSAHGFMNYRMKLPLEQDPIEMMKKLKRLKDEDPDLQITYHESKKEIRLQVMGEVQMEILKQRILDLYHVEVDFDEGMVAYKESIVDSVEGVGHYEPLRHYSEVHIRLEPLPRGSGLQFDSEASLDQLERHYQRLILSHMKEKMHVGVLGGFPITDMKLTLLSGKAHIKHTEGGDFREATYRAIRHGLMKAQSVLLEPYYHFRIEVPQEFYAKVLYDLEMMHATIHKSEVQNDLMITYGEASVASLATYPIRLRSISKGKGMIQCNQVFYHEVSDQKAILQTLNYDPLSDLQNPCGSIFCEHGAAMFVECDKVEDHMHLPLAQNGRSKESLSHNPIKVDENDLKKIMEGLGGRNKAKKKYKKVSEESSYVAKKIEIKPQCILVDGYNIIFDWKLNKNDDIASARDQLIDMMCSYQALKKCELILVFDAYKVDNHQVKAHQVDNIHVIYTKKSQTADAYIEQATHRLSKDYQVLVASSDGLEQIIVAAQGAIRMSASEFLKEVNTAHEKVYRNLNENQPVFRHMALEVLRDLFKNEQNN